jgi:hypothetical protein
MAVFTFANTGDQGRDVAEVVRTLNDALNERYRGCAAKVIHVSDGGARATISLSMASGVESSACLDWFADQLARESITLVRDHNVERILRRIPNA